MKVEKNLIYYILCKRAHITYSDSKINIYECFITILSMSWFLQVNMNREPSPYEEHQKEEAATRGFLCNKVFLEISQHSQKNICARPTTLLRKRLWHRCFPVNFVKFLRTPFLQNTSRRLLLKKALN